MFAKKSSNNLGLEEIINELQTRMLTIEGGSEEFAATVDQLSKLYAVKDKDSLKPVSRDTLALIAGNLAGIVLIINYERANVISSKALSFVMKLR